MLFSGAKWYYLSYAIPRTVDQTMQMYGDVEGFFCDKITLVDQPLAERVSSFCWEIVEICQVYILYNRSSPSIID